MMCCIVVVLLSFKKLINFLDVLKFIKFQEQTVEINLWNKNHYRFTSISGIIRYLLSKDSIKYKYIKYLDMSQIPLKIKNRT